MLNEIEEKFINRFLFHTRSVQNNMILLEKQNNKFLKLKDFSLINRALKHDLDKLKPNKIKNYIIISRYHYLNNNHLPNSINIDDYKDFTQKHYKFQRHHFYDNDIKPNIIDLCETCCDIDAVANELGEKTNTIYFDNFLMKNYQKIRDNENIMRKILEKLKDKKPIISNLNKANFIDNYISFVRKFQDYIILMEKENSYPYKKWYLTRFALNFFKNDFLEKNLKIIHNFDKKMLFNYYIDKLKNVNLDKNIHDIIITKLKTSIFSNDF